MKMMVRIKMVVSIRMMTMTIRTLTIRTMMMVTMKIREMKKIRLHTQILLKVIKNNMLLVVMMMP